VHPTGADLGDKLRSPGRSKVVSDLGFRETTLVKGLSNGFGLRRSVSGDHRTRGRGSSRKSYFFVGEEDFREAKKGKLVEWAKVHGYFYGTLRILSRRSSESGFDVVLSIDVQGGRQVEKGLSRSVITIFILPPTYEVSSNE